MIGAVVLAGGGIGYYFKIYKPKHEAPDLEDDYVKHFLIIISAGKGDAPKVGRYLIFMTLSLRVGCERFKRTFYLQQLKSQIGLLYLSEGVCLAFSKLLFLLRNLDFQAEFF